MQTVLSIWVLANPPHEVLANVNLPFFAPSASALIEKQKKQGSTAVIQDALDPKRLLSLHVHIGAGILLSPGRLSLCSRRDS